MKSTIILTAILTFSVLLNIGCNSGPEYGVEPFKISEAGLNWYNIDDIDKMTNIEDKTILVDVYTDWCGWCKKLDKMTFGDPEVIKHLNENFIMVKFDAEQQAPVVFNGESYEAVQMGRKKTNKLAIKFLNGRLGYPNLVYIDGKTREKISSVPGFKEPAQMIAELQSIRSKVPVTAS